MWNYVSKSVARNPLYHNTREMIFPSSAKGEWAIELLACSTIESLSMKVPLTHERDLHYVDVLQEEIGLDPILNLYTLTTGL